MAGRYVFSALILLFALAPCLAGAQSQDSSDGPYAWSRLNAQQRTALAPLSREWNEISDFRKLKWLGIARRYSRLKPLEQARMQDRMREWINLTPTQREIVRNQFKVLRSVPSETKNELGRKWQEYAALPLEEKKRLAENAQRGHVTAIPSAAMGARLTTDDSDGSMISPYSTIAPRVLSQTPPPGGRSRPFSYRSP